MLKFDTIKEVKILQYKTISLKLNNLTSKKRMLLDEAIEDYSKAFEILLKELKEVYNNEQPLTKNYCLKLMNKDVMKCLDDAGVEPFKDALKLDVAEVVSTYYGRKINGRTANYPVSRVEDIDILNLINGDKQLNKREINFLYNKYRKTRPLLFCRYDLDRDYTLLKDTTNNRYYAKLYLFNRYKAVSAVRTDKKLKYVKKDEIYLKENKERVRYVLFPIQSGEWQNRHLDDIEKGISVPKSAELIKRDNEYYLNIRLEVMVPPKETYKSFLGVVRGINKDIYYAISDLDGQIIKNGSINEDELYGINKLHTLSKGIVSIAKENSSQIIMVNLGVKNDDLKERNISIPLSNGDYNKFVGFTNYKAELEGLNMPVLVSPRGIFYRCPQCDTFSYLNRFIVDKFLCVKCGYAQNIEHIGAANLARTLIKYEKKKIVIYYKRIDGYIEFYCKPLGLEYKCTDSEDALINFFSFLDDFIKTCSEGFISKQQSSVIKKLTSKDDFRKLINFIEI